MRKTTLLLALLLCLGPLSALAESRTYTNPITGYRAVMDDEIDLLTAEQEEA